MVKFRQGWDCGSRQAKRRRAVIRAAGGAGQCPRPAFIVSWLPNGAGFIAAFSEDEELQWE